jgi:hypothetical protein
VSGLDELRGRLLAAAEHFAAGDTVAGILTGIVEDVDRALAERLEIFPVCHHSPASALAMVRRLRDRQPRVIYLELCEDLRPLLAELPNCQFPVALQAFASRADDFPPHWAPLSVVAPLTEASAEYQAIAYSLQNPGTELVLVDRSADVVFQWLPREEPEAAGGAGAGAEAAAPDEAAGEQQGDRHDAADLHGDAVGVQIGDLRPRFAELERFLLHHGKVRHWSEWWDQYVEQPLAGADYDTYRRAMVLIGSLFRRLAPGEGGRRRLAVDEDRERYMWTRIRAHLAASGADPADCLYICGAFHAASRVEQFGTSSAAPPFEIPTPTSTGWLYGLIPSSHSAIEAQFGLAPGSVSIAAASWAKSLSRSSLTGFQLGAKKAAPLRKRAARAEVAPAAAVPAPAQDQDRLLGFLASPPALDTLDEEELLGWSVEIVRLARRHAYLASTADAIAVFETSILLAGMRGRARPTPYDFQDAAITCIEKDVVPGRRDVRRLCEILLGGDRIGRVGYDALPPLARDVYDRLAPLGIESKHRTVHRALLDLAAQPELRGCSDLLWMLRYLLPRDAVRVIMGSRRLGEQSVQESWDVAVGRHQRSLIELGYEGISVEQVLEQRLRRSAWEPDANAAVALAAVEDAIVLLGSQRLVDELGARAVELLAGERTVDNAPEVLRRIRRLLAYHRAAGPQLPPWCAAFVTEGYAHYCTLLPSAFVEDEAGLRQVAAMLGFLFSMESVALSFGCDRAQLELAVAQSHPESPGKVALLWAARTQLGQMSTGDLRSRCDELLANPLVVPAFPQYLSGLVQALEPVPTLAGFVVEMLSKAFASLPDPVLLPWLPRLITTLRAEAAEFVPLLVREAGRTFPGTLPALDAFLPPWAARPAAVALAGPVGAAPAGTAPPGAAPAGPVADLLRSHPSTVDDVAALFGCAEGWAPADRGQAGVAADQSPADEAADRTAIGELLAAYPAALEAVSGSPG